MSNPSVAFPTDVGLYWPYQQGPTFKNFVQTLADGSKQVRQLWRTSGVQTGTLITEALIESRRQPVGDFLAALVGELVPYYLFLPDVGTTYKKFNIGTSTAGPGQVIGIPFFASTVTALYVDGVSKAFTQQTAVGTFSEDQVTITGAQTAGKVVTIDCTGRRRLAVRGGPTDAVATLLEGYSPLMWQYTLHFREI